MYSQRCREAFKGVPIIAGGVEVSMRRMAHVDYWHEKVKRSLILDARVDLAVYGMGEKALLGIIDRLQAGEKIEEIHDIPGTAYAIGKHGRPHFYPQKNWQQGTPWWEQTGDFTDSILELPSYDEIRGHDDVSKERFARAQHLFHREQNPDSAPILVQRHGDHTLVVNRPMKALETDELDRVSHCPTTRNPTRVTAMKRFPPMRRSSFPSTSCVAVLAAVLSAPSQSIRAVQFLLAVKRVFFRRSRI